MMWLKVVYELIHRKTMAVDLHHASEEDGHQRAEQ